MGKMRTAIDFTRRNGVLTLVQECYFQLTTRYYESYFNVDTELTLSDAAIEYPNDECCSYSSVHYSHIINVFNRLPVDKEISTFLDFGCGKGRATIAASAYPFRRIIGVELTHLLTLAEANLARMRHRIANNVVLWQCNATDYTVPADVNVIYFYNPFRGSILESVTRNIHRSYRQTPRRIYIIFFNNDHFDQTIRHAKWLTKLFQRTFYPDISCGLYETG